MDSLNKSQRKVSLEVPYKPSVFTFVPVVQKLPIESIVTEEERSGALTGKQHKNSAVSHKTTSETMSDKEVFKAERVFIRDSAEGGAENTTEPGTKLQPLSGCVSLSQAKGFPSPSDQSENTLNHGAAGTASMETAVDKHRDISQRHCHDTAGFAEVSSSYFANRASVSEDRMSPTHSRDLFPTPASSKESILSEGSDREKSWSAVQLSCVTSPVSFSRTVSPCSSVRSGIFSPAVVQIKRHFLAPGSSLVHTPCFSSCESLSSSIYFQSPPPPPDRHRPPLTRLSLLTAILRKGRLPVLSSALQRPYTPCWPVNPVTLSFCNACSAASSVASIPLEFSSRFSSSVSIDSQSHVQREPNRCVTAPPPVQSSELSKTCPQVQVKRSSEQIRPSSAPRWGHVISPPTVKSTLPPAPPLFCSIFKSVSPPKHEEIDHIISKKPANADIMDPADNYLNKNIFVPQKGLYEQETSAPKKLSRPEDSSLSRLHSLSHQLRSPLRSPGVTTLCDTASAPEPHTTVRSCPDPKSATTSAGFHNAHCLSPSRYKPITFLGWPSPTNSPTPTPSPAPPIRDLTPSPSLSMRSTPSPRPGSGISDCSDREGKKRKTHKIKLNYKSLAAIPTNKLLLDQQAIDEQVEREESPSYRLDRGVADTHSEMCSPAELRQQSEELYAVIDEILADSSPASKIRSQEASRSSNSGLQKNNSSFTKSLGRETKYASVCSLHPSTDEERNLINPKKTKPGVIRPMTAIPRLTVEDEERFHQKPFGQFVVKQMSTGNKKLESMSPEEARKDFYTSSKGQTLKEERKPERKGPLSVGDLQITEPEDQMTPSVKDTSTSFSATEGRMETYLKHSH